MWPKFEKKSELGGKVVLTHLNPSPQSESFPPVETSWRRPRFCAFFIDIRRLALMPVQCK